MSITAHAWDEIISNNYMMNKFSIFLPFMESATLRQALTLEVNVKFVPRISSPSSQGRDLRTVLTP